jgi:tRNA 2-thiouridine synthesizing protein A
MSINKIVNKIADHRIQPFIILDAKGLNCPLPLLKIKKEIAKLEPGQIIQIDSTDTGSRNEIYGWCQRSGNEYLGEREEYEYMQFFIKKV